MSINQDHWTGWPNSWAKQHSKAIERFCQVRNTTRTGPIVELLDGVPVSLYFDDRVLHGIARKAAATMRSTCSNCGRPGRALQTDGQWSVQCAPCSVKSLLPAQIKCLIDEFLGVSDAPTYASVTVWHEHDVPPLLRSAIPSHLWRVTQPRGCDALRYLARDDLEALLPWLRKLAIIINDD